MVDPFPLIAHPAFRSAPEQQGFSNINQHAVAMQSIRAVIVTPPQPLWARVLRDPSLSLSLSLSLSHTHTQSRAHTHTFAAADPLPLHARGHQKQYNDE